ncbi:hypothetical protein N9U51_03325 [Candidatus Pelagibacter sp.]|nr:hypothetical protein [Candidatus Pelagibacter sp.]
MNENQFKDCTIVITTFFAGEKLEKCINQLPKNIKKLIIDNGNEISKKNIFEKNYNNLIYYLSNENLGVPRSYSLADSLVDTKYMFNTQPDVLIQKNCIEILLEKKKLYENSAILSPTIFHEGKYFLDGDYKILKIKNNKLIETKKFFFNQKLNKKPDGDLSVDAVTGTAMLIDREKLKEINGWDTNIFNYFEDMDLCLRFRQKGYEIIKISNAFVDHHAFSSHDVKFHKQLDYSRNWHYAWSNIYFFKKNISKYNGLTKGIKMFITSFIKSIVYLLFNKKKSISHFAKSTGSIYSILGFKSSHRPNLKK